MDYKDIIQLIRDKTPAGLEALYQAYGAKFYSYAVQRWYLSEDEAWDVTYQTLETLVLKLNNYHFASKPLFEGFMFKVMVNFLRQHFRKKRSAQQGELVFMDMNDEEGVPGMLNSQISKASFSEYYKAEVVESPALLALNEALEKLESTEKDLLLLRAQDYSYDEIAAMLQIDNNQLKVKHHRAKQKLMNHIKEIENK